MKREGVSLACIFLSASLLQSDAFRTEQSTSRLASSDGVVGFSGNLHDRNHHEDAKQAVGAAPNIFPGLLELPPPSLMEASWQRAKKTGSLLAQSSTYISKFAVDFIIVVLVIIVILVMGMAYYLVVYMEPRRAEKRSPKEVESWVPSAMSCKEATPSLRDFAEISVEVPYKGDKKILVCCTSEFLLKCSNGKFFNTGHHASTIFVFLYHLDKCGFEFDIATADGCPVAIEEWTFPMATGYESKLREIQAKLRNQLEKPIKFTDVPVDLASHAAIFLPGGQGPLIDMHKTKALGALLRSAHDQALPTIAICHGATALRACSLDGGEFPYKGYELVVFPDKMEGRDGYMPGMLSDDFHLGAKLKGLGIFIQNTEINASTHVDRELITACSQMSAQKLSVLVIETLSNKYKFKVF